MLCCACCFVLPLQGDVADFLVLLLSSLSGRLVPAGSREVELWECLTPALEGRGSCKTGIGGVEVGNPLEISVVGMMNRINFR